MSKTLSARLFFVLLLFGTVFFLTGCGNSGSSGDKPPSYSPARVLTPEAPGKQTLVKDGMNDVEILKAFYTYVTEHITYDYDKADSVEAGYLPDVDETLQSGTGICFDYAALTAAMLRSQDIPCKLEIGYSGDIKHAWIDVYIQNKGWVTKAISFDGDTWKLMDPTFDANSNGNEAIQEYIGDESNYTVQYTH